MGGWLLFILSKTLPLIPYSIRLRLISSLGTLYGVIPHSQRRAVQYNLKKLFGFPPQKINSTTRLVFKNFALTLHDFFEPHNIQFSAPDKSRLESIRTQYGGVMLITFHFGNWELGAHQMNKWGWPVTAVYQPYRSKRFKKLIESKRPAGVNFIPVGRLASHGVQKALKRGDVVAMLGDHFFGEGGIPVDLLGHRVRWPKGPILLAVKEKAPIIVGSVFRESPGVYHSHMQDPLIPQDSSIAEANRLTQEVATKFGILLRSHPEQWLWMRKLEFL